MCPGCGVASRGYVVVSSSTRSRKTTLRVAAQERLLADLETKCGGYAQEGRRHRDRRHDRGVTSECLLPGGARQRAQGPGPYQREDADALHPDPARRPGRRGAEPLRPVPRADRLPLQVTDLQVTERGGGTRRDSPRKCP